MIFIPIKEIGFNGEVHLRCVNIAEIEMFTSSALSGDNTYIRLRSGNGFYAGIDFETFADILDDYIKTYPEGGVAPLSEGGVNFD